MRLGGSLEVSGTEASINLYDNPKCIGFTRTLDVLDWRICPGGEIPSPQGTTEFRGYICSHVDVASVRVALAHSFFWFCSVAYDRFVRIVLK